MSANHPDILPEQSKPENQHADVAYMLMEATGEKIPLVKFYASEVTEEDELESEEEVEAVTEAAATTPSPATVAREQGTKVAQPSASK